MGNTLSGRFRGELPTDRDLGDVCTLPLQLAPAPKRPARPLAPRIKEVSPARTPTFTGRLATHATCFSPPRASSTPCTIDRHAAHVGGEAPRPVKRCRIDALEERIPPALRLDGAHAAAVGFVHDVVADFEDASACRRLVWHALAIYRRARVDLAEAPHDPPALDVVLAASLLLAQRLVTNTTSALAKLGPLTSAFGSAGAEQLSAESIAACSWRIALSRGYDFACARSCPFDVAADVLLAHVGGSGDTALRCLLPPYELLEVCVADRLREAGKHLLALASSSGGIASEDHAVLGAAAALCAIRAKDGPLTPAALDGVLERLGLREHRAVVLAAALQMRAEHLVLTVLHVLGAEARARISLSVICSAHSRSTECSSLREMAATFGS